MGLNVHYLTFERNHLEMARITNNHFIMSFLTIFAFLRFDHGARALMANIGGRQVGA